MEVLTNFVHRYVAPFLAGVCMAGASVVHDVPQIAALVLAAGICGYFSLPAGCRMLKRLSGMSS